MLRSRRLLRFSTALALFGAPGIVSFGGQPGADTQTAGGGVVLRYKPGAAKIKEDLKVSFTASGGGQGGEMKADITGLLDLTDAGTDKLKVAYSILDVRQFELSGGMKPEPKDERGSWPPGPPSGPPGPPR